MNVPSPPRTALIALALTSVLVAAPARGTEIAEPGLLTLDLGVTDPSYLGVMRQDLATALCGSPPDGDTKDPKMLAANDGGHRLNAVGLEVLSSHDEGDGTTVEVAVQAAGFDLTGGELLETHCGKWSYRVILEPAALQPPATLKLLRADAAATSGVFTGAVPIAARMEFTPEEGLGALAFPLDLTLELQGPWAAARPSLQSPPLDEGGRVPERAPTNLVLLATFANGQYEPASTPTVQRSIQYSALGQLVLEASAEALATLNGTAGDR